MEEKKEKKPQKTDFFFCSFPAPVGILWDVPAFPAGVGWIRPLLPFPEGISWIQPLFWHSRVDFYGSIPSPAIPTVVFMDPIPVLAFQSGSVLPFQGGFLMDPTSPAIPRGGFMDPIPVLAFPA